MRKYRQAIQSTMAALAMSASSFAAVPGDSSPVFIEGSQYSATLNQRTQSWRLSPLDGQDLVVASRNPGCATGASIPSGVWLVVRDAHGRPQLLAPSTTELPAGYPETVALAACGEGHGDQPYVAAPQALIDWLATRSGAIMVDE